MLAAFANEGILEAGLDEAGRGPLFGPVYVAACVLPQDDSFDHSLIRDSKKLTKKKREWAFDYIKNYAIDYSIVSYDHNKIDKLNVHKATYTAMEEAISNLSIRPEHLLIDGNYWNKHIANPISYTCFKGGDDLYTPIGAASILAKVSRDQWIENLCDKHPELNTYYQIRSNKGYGSKEHMEGIKKYGLTHWHRKTFGICKTITKTLKLV
jgi:ribonuclease HII